MVTKVYAGTLYGLNAQLLEVETALVKGLPQLNMIGLLSGEAKEAGARVRAALQSAGIDIPAARITVNYAPASVPKRGTSMDLATAVGILAAMELLREEDTRGVFMVGELGLDGQVKRIPGILSFAMKAREEGFHTLILPYENASEGAIIPGIKSVGVRSLKQTIRYLMEPPETRERIIAPAGTKIMKQETGEHMAPDFADVKGQSMAKRMLEIAAAGFHNAMLIGPPGSGKSMLASCLPGILPPLTAEESIRVSEIYSIAGKLEEGMLIKKRPFLAPHHSVTGPALVGGGLIPQPGLITLAHQGVLFMDEFPEFGREKIDLLREPLEERTVRIVRNAGTFVYPANFLLLCAMNPCPCGYYPDVQKCTCTEPMIRKYNARVSGPILDRIDLFAGMERVTAEELHRKEKEESSEAIRERVMRAREIQSRRFREEAYGFNAEIAAADLKKYCCMDAEAEDYGKEIYEKLYLTARSFHRLLRSARTIADLSGEEKISIVHLTEAAGYRYRG